MLSSRANDGNNLLGSHVVVLKGCVVDTIACFVRRTNQPYLCVGCVFVDVPADLGEVDDFSDQTFRRHFCAFNGCHSDVVLWIAPQLNFNLLAHQDQARNTQHATLDGWRRIAGLVEALIVATVTALLIASPNLSRRTQ